CLPSFNIRSCCAESASGRATARKQIATLDMECFLQKSNSNHCAIVIDRRAVKVPAASASYRTEDFSWRQKVPVESDNRWSPGGNESRNRNRTNSLMCGALNLISCSRAVFRE